MSVLPACLFNISLTPRIAFIKNDIVMDELESGTRKKNY